ncbi:MAG TPA: hypothetical protein H9704_12845, partial [Candidatus Enterocloster excrementipullorum]|nr:hypothetical protein [Candidatus Enterocloster excrementipullorum]
PSLPETVEGEAGSTVTYTAMYVEDINNDNTPDKDQLVTLTFTSEYGFKGQEEGTTTVTLADQVPGMSFTAPNPLDTDSDGVVFTGWNPDLDFTVPGQDKTYRAVYEEDHNNDNRPDTEQTVTLTFQIAPEDQTKGTFEGGIYTYTDSQITGEKLTAPMVNDAEGDDWAFAGWNPAVTEDTLVPEEGITYTAVWAADMNHDNRPDDAQMVAITFDTTDTAKGYFGDRQQTATVEMLPGTSLQPDGFTDVSGDSWAFDGWVDANGQEVTIVPGTDAAYTAKWAVDWNHNNVPDTDEGYVPPSGNSDGSDGSSGGSSSSDSDGSSTYTVGTDGRWVHMDPQDPTIPITIDVPEYATPQSHPEYHLWKFIRNDNTAITGRWAFIKNPYAQDGQPSEGWFFFDNDGWMQHGWYLGPDGNWYVLHDTSDGMLGTMLTGWYQDDQDGKWYYLNPSDGRMLTGWQNIGGTWYYFNEYTPEYTWEYDTATENWKYNGSSQKPYGSMYSGETTPDGYTVNEDGSWRQ